MSPAPLLLHGRGRLVGAPHPAARQTEARSPWALAIDGEGRIAWVGEAVADAPAPFAAAEPLDLGEQLITPGLVDPHTHPVFAGDRADEAAARLEGAPYSGGGILRTVERTRAASDEELTALVAWRLRAALAAGTTTVEGKSGYGLSVDEELRQLRLLRAAAASLPLRVVPTFLGAHAVPPGTERGAYVDLVVDEMLPAVAAEGLAQACDVFCDAGFFDLAETERILGAARAHGLAARFHADQLQLTGAAALGARLGAASVDHLEQLDTAGVTTLAASDTVATLLPAPALVLRDRLPPARALLDAGARVALGSDANAGTFSGWGAMPLVIGLGATLLGMSVAEALAAATAGSAAALGLAGSIGTLAIGSQADLVAWDADHEGAFALRLGAVRAERTWIGGHEVAGRG